MASINSTGQNPGNMSSLTADGDIFGVGIALKWSYPSDSNIFATEIWASGTNNRNFATLVATVVGNQYIHSVIPNSHKYYWIRGLSRVKLVPGQFYPELSGEGVVGINVEPVVFLNGIYGNSFVGDNTWKTVENVIVQNKSKYSASSSFILTAEQIYTGDADTQFRITKTNDGSPVTDTFQLVPDKVYYPTISKIITIPANIPVSHVYTIQWKGSNSNVTLINPVINIIKP